MTSTIFLSISRFISIFASVFQSFKIVIKISSHPEHVHTSLPPFWLPLTFDSRLHRSQLFHDSHKTNVTLTHGYRTTFANTRFLQTGQPHVSLYSNSHHLTTSINIRLPHGSRTTVANTVRECLLASLSNPIQSKKSEYIHGHLNKLPPNGGDKENFKNKAFKMGFTQLKIKIIERFKLKIKLTKTNI